MPESSGSPGESSAAEVIVRRRRRRRRRRQEEGDREADDRSAGDLGAPDTFAGRLRALWLVLVPLAASFFGAGRETWSHGLAVMLSGSALVLAPPRFRLPRAGVILLVLMALAPLAGFLPASWLGDLPDWRRQLTTEWGLPLGGAVSPQPAVTLEAWLTILCGIGWLWSCLGQGYGEPLRRLSLRALMLGGGVLAGLSLLEHWDKVQIPWWPRDERSWGMGFGPFANRNHTSSLCAIMAVVAAAVAHDAFRRRSSWWAPAVLAFLTALATILVNTSRGGLLLFFLGMILWLGTAAMRRGLLKKAAVSVSVLIAVGSVVLVSGGQLSHRMKTGFQWESLSADYRVLLFGDAMRMAAKAPAAGVGMGNFSTVYPQMTTLHLPNVRFLHPESDVLWLLVEGGLLALLPCLLLVIWLTRVTGPWRSSGDPKSRLDRRLRRAAGVGVLVALLHGWVDVPLHGLAFFLTVALLLGLAVRPAALAGPAGRWRSWLFRAVGLVILGMGACWVAIDRGRLEAPVASHARRLHSEAVAKTRARAPAAAMAMVERAIQLTPLDYRLHHLRAQLRLQLGQGSPRALHDFGLARALEPNVVNFCYWEGAYWLAYEPILATVPWREWIRRSGPGAETLWGGYRQMVLDAEPFPELIATLRQMATTPTMKLTFLMAAKPGPEWQKCLDQLLAEDPNLEAFNGEKFAFLFGAWQQHGDRQALIGALESHPAWQPHGWRILAEEYASRGDFKAAYEMAEKHQPARVAPPVPVTSPRLDSLRRMVLLNPTDPLPAMDLYFALRAAGEGDEALYTLQKVAELPGSPPFLKREWAVLLAERGDYRRAWELLMRSIEESKR